MLMAAEVSEDTGVMPLMAGLSRPRSKTRGQRRQCARFS